MNNSFVKNIPSKRLICHRAFDLSFASNEILNIKKRIKNHEAKLDSEQRILSAIFQKSRIFKIITSFSRFVKLSLMCCYSNK